MTHKHLSIEINMVRPDERSLHKAFIIQRKFINAVPSTIIGPSSASPVKPLVIAAWNTASTRSVEDSQNRVKLTLSFSPSFTNTVMLIRLDSMPRAVIKLEATTPNQKAK
ncbi:hypothetical protein Bpfe_021585 [Biomphalaria pfeifferi]|uniref:Uncharacterized protein n=1 Tax=Biomphalaria pfeifferi TaxID=112525 RepID=A0AAD8B6M1_BIOPF|nr:hypothetical protein Bpfe_021585 [Biomphalaria pfeifferi]